MSFSGTVNDWCNNVVPNYVDRTIRRAVFEVWNRLDFRSPVGDPSTWSSPAPPGYVGGRFRANWQYGFNSQPSTLLDEIDTDGSRTRERVFNAVMSGPAIGVHYLTNNSPYGQRLEEGWSQQAPFGMVALTELEFPDIFRIAQQ